jgi:hypothetical protein
MEWAAALVTSTLAATAAGSQPVYTLAATKRCLVARGVRVTTIRPTDLRLKALHDLAQHTSIEATSRRGIVALAFLRNASDAAFLAETLRVPNDPYHVVLRKNTLLMFRDRSRKAFDVAVACLRPRRLAVSRSITDHTFAPDTSRRAAQRRNSSY